MEEENINQKLKDNNVTCPRVRSMIKNKIDDAQLFRKLGFEGSANREEATKNELRRLYDKMGCQ